MNRPSRRPAMRAFMPSYERNAVLQLIMATGICFIIYFFTAVAFQAFAHSRYEEGAQKVLNVVALPPAGAFLQKIWTLFTYSLFSSNFLAWLGNAIWLYFWGNAFQMLASYRNVIPAFAFGSIAGALMALCVQLIPGVAPPASIIGAQAGLLGLAAATFILSPDYRFWFTSDFSLPIKIVLPIYLVLTFFSVPPTTVSLCWMAGGFLGGLLYVALLKRGIKIGEPVYNFFENLSRKVAPAEHGASQSRRAPVVQRRPNAATLRQQDAQKRVDGLLEKILVRGYESLTEEEKEFLKKAGENI